MPTFDSNGGGHRTQVAETRSPSPLDERDYKDDGGCDQLRNGADACCRAWISMKTLISDTAAGVTPGMRLAWPNVCGRTRASFSFISRDKALTFAASNPPG